MIEPVLVKTVSNFNSSVERVTCASGLVMKDSFLQALKRIRTQMEVNRRFFIDVKSKTKCLKEEINQENKRERSLPVGRHGDKGVFLKNYVRIGFVHSLFLFFSFDLLAIQREARQRVATDSFTLSAVKSSFPHASSVAPVVITSSTNNKCLF